MRLLQAAAVFSGIADLASAVTNPIKVKSAKFVGNVTSTNTAFSRDLGFQGQVGSCWINTFGDDFLCQTKNPQTNCNFGAISARNSCGRPTSPTTFQDIFINSEGQPVQCVPDIFFESATNPSGITNAVPTGPNTGIIYILAGNATVFDPSVSQNTNFVGAGFATVKASDDCATIKVTRVFTNEWFGNQASIGLTPFNETLYGDHGALLAQDGYLYVYGGIPGYSGAVGLARVLPKLSAVQPAYEYWNGKAFQAERIFNPTPKVAVMTGLGQGSVFWSKHYKRYIYLTSFVGFVTARTAVNPSGPWSDGITLYSVEDMPYRFVPAGGSFESFYSPGIQPKYSAADDSSILFWVTYSVGKAANADHGGHQVTTAVKVTFA